jgi:rRNA-processing protein EBP2
MVRREEFDVNAFIQEQKLDIDDDVKLLLNADLDLYKKKKVKILEHSDTDSDTDLEMMAYNEMMEPREIQEKTFINRPEAIESRLFDIQQDLDWIETVVITLPNLTSQEETSDDLKRELKFYEQALEAAKEAKIKIQEAGVAFTRPDDYFAEMVKSDDHMKKVKQRLLDEASALKASEMARKQREAKKVIIF